MSTSEPATGTEGSRRPDRVLLVGVLLAIALAAYAVVLGVSGEDRGATAVPQVGLAAMFDDDRAQAAVTTASDQVVGLLTLDPDTVDQTLETLTARTTGDFQRQFEALVQTFASVVRKGDVSTTGEINGAGLVDLTDDTASVLVASSASVTNTQSTTPTPRSYRMRVELQWVDTDWLVSGIEFVGGKGQ
ncbi:hypothetical protein BH11ACT8_BH11ACT8_12860 [soil metagenome]